MKNVLVTGCAGFIGSHLVYKLLEKGNNVIGVDNFNDYYNPKIKEKNIEKALHNENFKLYKTDIRDYSSLAVIFDENKIDVVVHIAARAGVRPSIEQPLLYYSVNVGGTLNLLELVREYGIKHFVFASSSSIYGNRKDAPFKETDRVDFPISPYAATKKACEEMGYVYHKLYNINFTGLRFFTVYGPGGRPDMAPYIFTRAVLEDREIPLFGDGSAQRDFTYIDDITDGIMLAVDKPLGYEIINLGNGNPIKIMDFINLIEKLSSKKAKIKYLPKQKGDVDLTYADISKARKLLGYNPKTSFEEGMKHVVVWMQESLKNKED